MNHNLNVAELEKANPERKMEQENGRKPFKLEETEIYKRRMKELNGRMPPFNPFAPFTLTLSLINPHFYTEQELAKIKKAYQSCYQQSSFSSHDNRMEEEGEMMSNKKRARFSSDESTTSNKSKPNKNNKKSTKKGKPTPPTPPPELPIHVRNKIADLNGTDVKFLMCKKLFKTDLNPNHNRLSMPLNEIKCDFLTDIEREKLESKKDGKSIGCEVGVLDPSFAEFSMRLKKWQMRSSCVYNLVENWNHLSSQNQLQEGSKLNIWSFRVNDKLYFTLNNKED